MSALIEALQKHSEKEVVDMVASYYGRRLFHLVSSKEKESTDALLAQLNEIRNIPVLKALPKAQQNKFYALCDDTEELIKE